MRGIRGVCHHNERGIGRISAEEEVEGAVWEEMWGQEREGAVEVIGGGGNGGERLEGFAGFIDGDEEGEGCGVGGEGFEGVGKGGGGGDAGSHRAGEVRREERIAASGNGSSIVREETSASVSSRGARPGKRFPAAESRIREGGFASTFIINSYMDSASVIAKARRRQTAHLT